MAITEQDIKLLKSARMTDTPDGGGRMTGNVVQSGVDNNIFDDVSNLDRVYGNVSLRKVFGGVFTPTTDKYLGARVILDSAPADPNVHALLFGASSLFDTRTQTSVKVESYLAPGGYYSGLLYGNHLAGMSTLMLIQQQDVALPAIGQVLLLRKNEGLSTEVDQYVRITAIASSVQTFTDAQGDFQRRVLTCSLSDPLRYAFPGFQASRIDADLSFVGYTRVFATVVADASQYYGIRPLATAASPGAFAIKADSVFSPLLPSAQIETPIADARSNSRSSGMVYSGDTLVQTFTMPFHPAQKMFVGGGILPSTLVIERGGVTLLDRGGVLQQDGAPVGAVDHANGIVSLSVDVFGSGGGTHTVGYVPAEQMDATSQSHGIAISISNRALNYVTTLYPAPAKGTLLVSYMSGGNWYELADNGDGALTGADPSLGAGTLNYATGTVTVTLGALPDVGSAVVLQWVEPQFAQPTASTDLLLGGKLYFAMNTDGLATEEPGSKALDPGTVSITWADGGTKTTTDNGAGLLTGDATGTVDYARGLVRISPNTLPPAGTVYTLSSSNTTRTTSTPVATNGGTVAPGLQPRTVSFALSIDVLHTLLRSDPAYGASNTAYTVENTPAAKSVQVLDDGSGNLVLGDGLNGLLTVGSVNYATGVISLLGSVAAGPLGLEGAVVAWPSTGGGAAFSGYITSQVSSTPGSVISHSSTAR